MSPRTKVVMAISSGGGHWIELLRLFRALQGGGVVYATVSKLYKTDVPGSRLYVFNDATRWNKAGLLAQAARVAWIVARVRPRAIVTTGAAPGYFAVRFGRILGARTLWIDSMANVERLSLAGEKAGPYADLWLTQWPHLARPGGPFYFGSVL